MAKDHQIHSKKAFNTKEKPNTHTEKKSHTRTGFLIQIVREWLNFPTSCHLPSPSICWPCPSSSKWIFELFFRKMIELSSCTSSGVQASGFPVPKTVLRQFVTGCALALFPPSLLWPAHFPICLWELRLPIALLYPPAVIVKFCWPCRYLLAAYTIPSCQSPTCKTLLVFSHCL